MSRLFRKLNYAVSGALHPEQDEVTSVGMAQQRLAELQRIMARWSSSLSGFSSTSASLHTQLNGVYPQGGQLSSELDRLCASLEGNNMEPGTADMQKFIMQWSATLSSEVESVLHRLEVSIAGVR
jgi:hypothetical protein